jgi:hypothetical protein
MTQAYEHFKKSWERALPSGHISHEYSEYPEYFRNLIKIDANEFVDKINNADQKTADEIVNSILAGDAYIWQGALTEKEIKEIKNAVLDWRSNLSEAKDENIIEGCEDSHIINADGKRGTGKYKVVNHSHLFFRWNGDQLAIFRKIDKYWDATKVLSGFPPSSFKATKPRHGTVDKLSIFQYPMDFGNISMHRDPPQFQKILLNMTMSEIGKDYASGNNGTYVVSGETKEKVYVENHAALGDFISICPAVRHGAPGPTYVDGHKDEKPKWNTPIGRWFLHTMIVPSHYVENRFSTLGIDDPDEM